jgi:YHS domain-containing protein
MSNTITPKNHYALLLLVLAVAVLPQMSATQAQPAEEKPEITHLFGNHKCPIMGGTVVPESFVTYEDKEKNVHGRVYMCCDGCSKKVEANLAELYQKFYRTDPKTGKSKEPKDLKNAECPMTGEPVAENASIEYNGMIVHFCCPECAKGFLKDPDGKLAKLLPEKELEKYKYERPAGSGSMK